MKIIIGTNTFGNYHRQNVAIDSLVHLKKTFDLQLFDVQFEGNTQHDNRLETLNTLSRSSLDHTTGSKQLPFVNDIFNVLCDQDCDYFIFCNSDVIVNGNLIKHIKEHKPHAMACSRLDIKHIDSFDDVLKKQIKPVRYEIAGFDCFIFSKVWYLEKKQLFRDYLVGQPCWDQVYATIIKLYGGNHSFGNQYPPFCFHIHHEPTWQNKSTPEKQFNMTQKNHHFDSLLCKIFDIYLKSVLIKRQPYGLFLTPVKNETDIEQQFFDNYIQ